jgi:putative zinc finger/helix-turn-helix YgiT family protein
MEEHEVKTVVVIENTMFKNVRVNYLAHYMYCDETKDLYMNEQQIQENDIRLKDAYRREEGFLTSSDIKGIRDKYGISQSDLCILLGWGRKTITRYEGHQIQDKAHDTILKKIDGDSEWFITLLNESKDKLKLESYYRCLNIASKIYENSQDMYLRKAIEANYAMLDNNPLNNGNKKLSLDKVVEVIRYLASSNAVTSLYKVKLMKMLWYADALSYKKRGVAITGLVYRAMPMGAVPVGHNYIINLKNVPCEERDMGEFNSYYFSLKEELSFSTLSNDDKEIIDEVIRKLGKMSKKQIVNFMHNEQAYTETLPRDIILFKHANSLQI